MREYTLITLNMPTSHIPEKQSAEYTKRKSAENIKTETSDKQGYRYQRYTE